MRRVKLFSLTIVLIIFSQISFAQDNLEKRIRNVESGLLPPVIVKGIDTWNIYDRMEHYKIPGVSIAVIKDFKVEWAKGYGVMDVETKEPVNEKTLFQAASISKPVAAAAALHIVEKGILSLDSDINQYLKSWKLPDNKFTENKKVTLKNLLSHTGGLTVHGFRGYEVDEEIPGIIEILNGEEPANSGAIRVNIEPGKRYRYSGGGFTIMQLMLTDLLKKPFPEILKETVLNPTGMESSTYEQPLPSKKVKFAAAGHRSGGIPVAGKRHTYPEMAAAGLWTTPADLAKFLIEIQKSLMGESNKVLSEKMTGAFLTPFISQSYGLGIAVSKMGDDIYFSHGGANEGFRCYMIANRDKGYGAVVMTNSDDGGRIYLEILRSIAKEYSWEGYLGKEYELAEPDITLLEKVKGRYLSNSDEVITISAEEENLFIRLTLNEKIKLYPVAPDTFVILESAEIVSFKEKQGQKIESIILKRGNRKREFKKITDNFKVPAELLLEGKLEEAAAAYKELKKKSKYDRNVREDRLNNLGYRFLNENKFDMALTVFKLNTELYPESANCYDSYAECFEKMGDNKNALKYYKKALKIMEEYPETNKNYSANAAAGVRVRIENLERKN